MNRWETLPAVPLRARIEHTAVWTGRAMLVWGGESCPDACFDGDGAAFVVG